MNASRVMVYLWSALVAALAATASCSSPVLSGPDAATATCTGSQVACGAVCVDTAADPDNCGGCGKPCAPGDVCAGGTCSLFCGGGTTACGTACVATLSDPANCGGCGKACATGDACSKGACVAACAAGEANCGGQCIDPLRDNGYCGATGSCTGASAGKVCPAGTACNGAGVCAATCAAPETLCTPDGGAAYCADRQTDSDNCGTCGNKCSASTTCVGGGCVSSSAAGCGASQTLCTPHTGAAYCADEKTDNANCGGCGAACPTGQACADGACVVTCQAPTTLCKPATGGADAGSWYCADLESDNANCRSCGHACAGGETCVHGACGCAAPQTLCTPDAGAPYCVDLQTDSDNCDACFHACSGVCSGGECMQQMTYDLVETDITPTNPTTCSSSTSDFFYSATPITITWTDMLPAGSTVQSVEVSLSWGYNCLLAQSGTATSTFNGTSFGPLASLGSCSCPPGGPFQNVNPLPAAEYRVGGSNALTYFPSTTAGWATDTNGFFGAVTITYTAP